MNGTNIETQIAGVILAAGGSERFGQPKQLLDWLGKPFIYQVTQHALEGGLSPVYIVTGSDGTLIAETVRDFPVQLIPNPAWARGLSTSMQAGLTALPEHCRAVMFLLCDQPQIPSRLIKRLIDHYLEHRAAVTAPKAGGRRGNPLIFAREAFKALKQVSGDKGGRAILDQFEMDEVPWEDERILMDVDCPEDLELLRQAYCTNL